MHKHSYIVDLNLMTYIGKCLQKSVFNVERIYKKNLKETEFLPQTQNF